MAAAAVPPTVHALVVGDRGVGKTSLLMRCRRPEAEPEDEFRPMVLDPLTAEVVVDGGRYRLHLSDSPGGADYRRLRGMAYPEADVIALCFAVDDKASLETLPAAWAPELAEHCPDTPILLVGLKTDARVAAEAERTVVSAKRARRMARRLRAGAYCETSKADGDACVAAAEEMVRVFVQARRRRLGNHRSRCDLM